MIYFQAHAANCSPQKCPVCLQRPDIPLLEPCSAPLWGHTLRQYMVSHVSHAFVAFQVRIPTMIPTMIPAMLPAMLCRFGFLPAWANPNPNPAGSDSYHDSCHDSRHAFQVRIPAILEMAQFRHVSCGMDHTCAIGRLPAEREWKVWCWGSNR